MTTLTTFSFQEQEVRFVGTPEVPEWVGADVVAIFYPHAVKKDRSNYLKKVPKEWKGMKQIHTLGGKQTVTTLYEPGLYWMIGRSDSLLAVPFQRWVNEDVLPSIRKTGKYALPQSVNTSNAVKLLDELKQSLQVLSEQLEAGHALLKAGNGMVRSLHNAIHNQGGSLNQAEKFLKKAQAQIEHMEEAIAGMGEGTLMIEQTTTTRVIVQSTSSARRQAVTSFIFELIDQYGSLEAIPRRGRGKAGINLEVEWGAAKLSKQFGITQNTVLDVWREIDEAIKRHGVEGARTRLLDSLDK